MEKKVISQEITHLLEVINEQTTLIHSHPSYIPQIELDIVCENIRKLYERFYELQKLNSIEAPVVKFVESVKEKEVIAPVETIIETPAVEALVSEPIAEVKIEEPVDELKAEEPVIVKPIEPDPVKIVEELEQLADLTLKEATPEPEKKSKSQKKPALDLFNTPTTIADKFKGENKSLNEKFSTTEKKEKSIADKLQEKPINDLKGAIGINDKFKFINELFDGNLQAYNDTISKLNSFKSFTEAGSFLDQIKIEYGWANENDSYTKLSDMVIRRYL